MALVRKRLAACSSRSLVREEIDGLAGLIKRAIKIAPLALDLDVHLVHAPTDPHRSFAAVKGLLQLWALLQHPAIDRRMVDGHAVFFHEFFDMPIAQGIGHVPPYSDEDNVLREMGTLIKLTIVDLPLLMLC